VENYQIATTLPNSLQMYQMAVTYSKLTQNLPTVSTLRPSQMAVKCINNFQSKALKKLPKIGIFGLKINRLATLVKWAFAKPGNINLFAASVPS
jgi:hypothetical protein